MNKIILGNSLEKLKYIESNSVDSIITDPPYELGFMGKKWDNTGIAYKVELWKECLRVLKPGGHLLSFSGTRTYHRMAVAIEDAGFEVRDMIEWVYGSGFPKSHNIGKAVDKLQGNEREDLGLHPRPGKSGKTHTRDGGAFKENIHITKGTSEWEGWGTALKPAHEPICMARKPLAEKTVAQNCLKWGTGGINIDEIRVDFISKEDKAESIGKNKHAEYKNSVVRNSAKNGIYSPDNRTPENYEPQGRFPANLIHDNSEEVRECFPDTKSQGHWSKTKTTGFGEFGNGSSEYLGIGGKDKEGGNASRFFKSIIYQAKASKSERNKGCEELETKQTQGGGGGIGDYQNDVNSMSGKYGSEKAPAKNNHPTVKPIALMEYLIKMVTPEGGVVLDPFTGSGTTLVAAKQNGFHYIGIEMTEEYIPIIEARLNNLICSKK